MDINNHLTSRNMFRKFGVIFLLLYIAAIGTMFIFLNTGNKNDLVSKFADNFENEHDEDSLNFVYIPKKPRPGKPTPSSSCFFDDQVFKVPRFQKLDGDTFILSGHYDARDPQDINIRLLALSRRGAPVEPIYCLFRGYNKTLNVITATFHEIGNNNSAEYGAYIMSCPTEKLLRDNPCKVYISHQKTIDAFHLTIPLLSKENNFYKNSFGICVPPLYGVLPQHRIVEFVEFHKILGADSIFLYEYVGDLTHNYSNPNIRQVTEYYKSTQYVTVYPWSLPVISHQVADLATILVQQHCLYSNMWNYQYLLFLDYDEFLIPHDSHNWATMIEPYVDNSDIYGTMCFKSAIFPPDTGEFLVSIASTLRTHFLNNTETCFFQPEELFVYQSSNSSIFFQNDKKTLLSDDVGLIHKYRQCTGDKVANCLDLSTDEIVSSFFKYLADEFKTAMHKISDTKIDTFL